MKYSSEVIIDMPLKEFINKFDNMENMRHWQRDLVSVEHLSGEPGMVGSKMKLVFANGKRIMEVIETVTHRRLPREFHGIYSTTGIDNFQEHYFAETKRGSTKWMMTSEFFPLNFKMNAMLWLMPKTFKKHTLRYMRDFKNFAEKGISVANATT